MLIVGAMGFAKELLGILEKNMDLDNLAFYDGINIGNEKLFEKFPVLKSQIEVLEHFKNFGPNFLLGLGNPVLRFKMYKKFQTLGGLLTSCKSEFSHVGNYNVHIGIGTNILDNAIISNSVKVGIGCIIYYNVTVTHDCFISDFVEVSPSANLLGRVSVGSFTHIGANATILPDVKIGKNVKIGAGAVVIRDLPDNCVAVGVPAKIIRNLEPLSTEYE